MPVPDFQTLMRPILFVLSDGQEHAVEDLRTELASEFELSESDLEERLPSGRAKTFNNRVGWATTYLYRCGLVARPRRSIYVITERGREVLEQNQQRVDLSVLSQFEELQKFRRARSNPVPPIRTSGATTLVTDDATPEERIAAAYGELRTAVAEELRDRILDQPPEFLEHLVLVVHLANPLAQASSTWPV